MSLPDVKVIKTNNNLGRPADTADGVAGLILTGIAVADKFALGDVNVIYSLQDAETLGINEDYDSTNKVLCHQHIKDFYKEAGDGAKLYIMVVAQTTTMAAIADKAETYAKKMLEDAAGDIKILGITRVPDDTYAATTVDGLDDDVTAAISKAQALAEEEFTEHRPVQIIIEGRDYQGVAGNLADLRTAGSYDANKVSVVLSADNEVSAAETEYAAYANAGLALGRLAAIPVQRNIGRVKDGGLDIDVPGFSDGSKLSATDSADLTAIDSKGYIFIRKHTGKAGYFFNNDYTACANTDDYSSIHRGRPIDKAARLVRQVYVDELLDDVEVDSDTGFLPPAVTKYFQNKAEQSIEVNMISKSEVSGASVFVNPEQNILSTDKLEIKLSVVPKGMVNEIEVKLGYENPAANS